MEDGVEPTILMSRLTERLQVEFINHLQLSQYELARACLLSLFDSHPTNVVQLLEGLISYGWKYLGPTEESQGTGKVWKLNYQMEPHFPTKSIPSVHHLKWLLYCDYCVLAEKAGVPNRIHEHSWVRVYADPETLPTVSKDDSKSCDEDSREASVDDVEDLLNMTVGTVDGSEVVGEMDSPIRDPEDNEPEESVEVVNPNITATDFSVLGCASEWNQLESWPIVRLIQFQILVHDALHLAWADIPTIAVTLYEFKGLYSKLFQLQFDPTLDPTNVEAPDACMEVRTQALSQVGGLTNLALHHIQRLFVIHPLLTSTLVYHITSLPSYVDYVNHVKSIKPTTEDTPSKQHLHAFFEDQLCRIIKVCFDDGGDMVLGCLYLKFLAHPTPLAHKLMAWLGKRTETLSGDGTNTIPPNLYWRITEALHVSPLLPIFEKAWARSYSQRSLDHFLVRKGLPKKAIDTKICDGVRWSELVQYASIHKESVLVIALKRALRFVEKAGQRLKKINLSTSAGIQDRVQAWLGDVFQPLVFRPLQPLTLLLSLSTQPGLPMVLRRAVAKALWNESASEPTAPSGLVLDPEIRHMCQEVTFRVRFASWLAESIAQLWKREPETVELSLSKLLGRQSPCPYSPLKADVVDQIACAMFDQTDHHSLLHCLHPWLLHLDPTSVMDWLGSRPCARHLRNRWADQGRKDDPPEKCIAKFGVQHEKQVDISLVAGFYAADSLIKMLSRSQISSDPFAVTNFIVNLEGLAKGIPLFYYRLHAIRVLFSMLFLTGSCPEDETSQSFLCSPDLMAKVLELLLNTTLACMTQVEGVANNEEQCTFQGLRCPETFAHQLKAMVAIIQCAKYRTLIADMVHNSTQHDDAERLRLFVGNPSTLMSMVLKKGNLDFCQKVLLPNFFAPICPESETPLQCYYHTYGSTIESNSRNWQWHDDVTADYRVACIMRDAMACNDPAQRRDCLQELRRFVDRVDALLFLPGEPKDTHQWLCDATGGVEIPQNLSPTSTGYSILEYLTKIRKSSPKFSMATLLMDFTYQFNWLAAGITGPMYEAIQSEQKVRQKVLIQIAAGIKNSQISRKDMYQAVRMLDMNPPIDWSWASTSGEPTMYLNSMLLHIARLSGILQPFNVDQELVADEVDFDVVLRNKISSKILTIMLKDRQYQKAADIAEVTHMNLLQLVVAECARNTDVVFDDDIANFLKTSNNNLLVSLACLLLRPATSWMPELLKLALESSLPFPTFNRWLHTRLRMIARVAQVMQNTSLDAGESRVSGEYHKRSLSEASEEYLKQDNANTHGLNASSGSSTSPTHGHGPNSSSTSSNDNPIIETPFSSPSKHSKQSGITIPDFLPPLVLGNPYFIHLNSSTQSRFPSLYEEHPLPFWQGMAYKTDPEALVDMASISFWTLLQQTLSTNAYLEETGHQPEDAYQTMNVTVLLVAASRLDVARKQEETKNRTSTNKKHNPFMHAMFHTNWEIKQTLRFGKKKKSLDSTSTVEFLKLIGFGKYAATASKLGYDDLADVDEDAIKEIVAADPFAGMRVPVLRGLLEQYKSWAAEKSELSFRGTTHHKAKRAQTRPGASRATRLVVGEEWDVVGMIEEHTKLPRDVLPQQWLIEKAESLMSRMANPSKAIDLLFHPLFAPFFAVDRVLELILMCLARIAVGPSVDQTVKQHMLSRYCKLTVINRMMQVVRGKWYVFDAMDGTSAASKVTELVAKERFFLAESVARTFTLDQRVYVDIYVAQVLHYCTHEELYKAFSKMGQLRPEVALDVLARVVDTENTAEGSRDYVWKPQIVSYIIDTLLPKIPHVSGHTWKQRLIGMQVVNLLPTQQAQALKHLVSVPNLIIECLIMSLDLDTVSTIYKNFPSLHDDSLLLAYAKKAMSLECIRGSTGNVFLTINDPPMSPSGKDLQDRKLWAPSDAPGMEALRKEHAFPSVSVYTFYALLCMVQDKAKGVSTCINTCSAISTAMETLEHPIPKLYLLDSIKKIVDFAHILKGEDDALLGGDSSLAAHMEGIEIMKILIANKVDQGLGPFALSTPAGGQKAITQALEMDRPKVALTIAQRYKLDASLVWLQWGLQCLKLCRFEEAREKLGHVKDRAFLPRILETLEQDVILHGELPFAVADKTYSPDEIREVIFEQSLHYLRLIGEEKDFVAFYLRHRKLSDACQAVFQRLLEPKSGDGSMGNSAPTIAQFFLDTIFSVCNTPKAASRLHESLLKVDPTLQNARPLLFGICRHLSAKKDFVSLFDWQGRMCDYIRAARTALLLFQQESQSTKRLEWLEKAKQNFLLGKDQPHAPESQGKFTACIPAGYASVDELPKSDDGIILPPTSMDRVQISSFQKTVSLQIELTKRFTNEPEITLYHSHERTMEITERLLVTHFDLGFEIMNEYRLSMTTLYSRCITNLLNPDAPNPVRVLDALMKKIRLTLDDDEYDQLIFLTVKLYYSQGDGKKAAAMAERILSRKTKFQALFLCHRFKEAYNMAIKDENPDEVALILQFAEASENKNLFTQGTINNCKKWLKRYHQSED